MGMILGYLEGMGHNMGTIPPFQYIYQISGHISTAGRVRSSLLNNTAPWQLYTYI